MLSDLQPGQRVLLFERANPLRLELGELAPFAVMELEPPRVTTPEALPQLLREANVHRVSYSAKLALLARVYSLDDLPWSRVLPDLNMRDLRKLVRRALPDEDASAVDFVDLYGLDALVHRIKDVEDRMQPFVDAILNVFGSGTPPVAAWFEPPGGFGDMQYGTAHLRVDTVPALASSGRAQLAPAMALSGGTLDMRIVPTGQVFGEETSQPFRGSPQFKAELFVRRDADVSGLASTARTVGDGQAFNAHAVAENGVQTVPLGVTIGPLHVDDRGRLMGEALIGISYARTDREMLRAALRTLGLPSLLMPRAIEIQPEFDSDRRLRSLHLKARLSIGGARLGEMSMPLIEDGRGVDVADALRHTVEDLLDDRLGHALARSAKFTRLARQPQRDVEWENAPIRFGIAVEDGMVPTSHQLDWIGGTLTLVTPFELSLGLDSARRVGATAEAELIPGAEGFAIRRIAFTTDAGSLLSDFVRQQLKLPDAFGDSVSLVPVFDGKTLHVELRAGFAVDGCKIRTGGSLPLDLEEIKNRLDEVVTGVGRDFKNCAASAAITEIQDWLGGRSETTLFGISVELILDEGRDIEAGLRSKAGDLEIDVLVPSGALQHCSPTELRIEGVRLSANRLDLSDLEPEDHANLGMVVLCRIKTLLPDLGRTVLISNPAIGPEVIEADVTLQDLPFVGTVPLGRIDFSDLANGDAVLSAVTRGARRALSRVLSDRFGGREAPLPGVGAFQLDSVNAVTVSLSGNSPAINLRGQVRISQYRLPVTIVLSLRGGGIDVRSDHAGLTRLIADEIVGAVADALPPLPYAGVRVDPFFFGPLDDHRLRWGIVFTAEAHFDLGDADITVVLDRVTISDEGMKLPSEIRIGFATPLVFPPGISLAKAVVIYRTDDNPTGAGLEIGAELTFFDPALARVLKFDALMDLTDIDRLRFFMEGDLVLLDTLRVFEVEADLQLGAGRFSYDGTTTEALRAILGLQLRGEANLPGKVLETQASLTMLGVKLSENILTICANRSGGCGSFPYGIRLESEHDLLITKTAVVAQTDLGFEEPKLGGDIHLSLFGWSPGEARFLADPRSVAVALEFLGIDISIVTPSVETMTPGHILAVLASLLDISLEDLLNADLSNITVSVVSGDGTVGDAGTQGNDDKGDEDGDPGGNDDNGRKDDDPGGNDENGQDDGDDQDIDEDPNAPQSLSPVAVAPWSRRVNGYACQKFSGRPDRGFYEGERVHIEGREGQIATEWNYRTWKIPQRGRLDLPLPMDDDFWLVNFREHHHWLFTGSAADQYCQLPPGQPIEMRAGIGRLGVMRTPVRLNNVDCPSEEDGRVSTPSISSLVVSDAEFASRAGLPVFCLPGGDVIGSAIFADEEHIHVLFRCPHRKRLSEPARRHMAYTQLCGPGKGFLEISRRQAGLSVTERVLDPLDELDFFNRFVRPLALGDRSILQRDEQVHFTISVDSDDDTEVRMVRDVGTSTGMLVFAIRHRKDDDSEVVAEYRVTNADPLFDAYKDRPRITHMQKRC